MAGFNVANTPNLIRTQIWSNQIKQLLLDDLVAMKFVRMISDFPDGFTLNIPSIGEAETADFTEGQAIKYNSMDTGNFQFQFDNYKYSANAISEKFKRDSYYSADVIAAFVPRQHRALMEAVETNILAKANSGQTASNANIINTADHRFVATGPGSGITFPDFARARYALTQANVVNLLTPAVRWQELPLEGLVSGFKFRFNIFGFDVYESNYLPQITTETITTGGVAGSVGTASGAGNIGVANYFFSATPGDTLPWVGAFRQMPTVYSEFNKDLQQEEYLTISEWGFKLYRPENLVTILTNITVVPS